MTTALRLIVMTLACFLACFKFIVGGDPVAVTCYTIVFVIQVIALCLDD